MRAEPTVTLVVAADTTVDTLGALPCPDGTRQTGGKDPANNVLGTDTSSSYCIEWPVPKGAIPVRRGPAVDFHPNGKLAAQGAFDASARTGTWLEWYDSGAKKSHIEWRAGEYDGIYLTWWDNGQPQSEIEWKLGKHHGISKSWGDDGKPLAVKRYDNDTATEVWSFDSEGAARKL